MVRTSGSFWNGMMRNNQQTRLLPNLVNKVRILNQLDIGFKQLLSQSNDLFVENQHVKYNPQQVVFAGNTFYDDRNLYEENGRFFNQSGDQFFWYIPMSDIYPLTIVSPTKGELLDTRDFFVDGGRIYFMLRPSDLFEGNQYLVSSGIVDQRGIYRWQLNFDQLKKNHYVVQFARTQQSIMSFKLAVAQLAGLQIVGQTSELLNKLSGSSSSVSYQFESETLIVDYSHTELTVGNTYDAGTIIGDGVEIIPADTSDSRWWRKADWTRGLSLSGITEYPGLHIPDEDCWAYIADADTGSAEGSKIHIRMDIPGDGGSDVNTYWDYVHGNETTYGSYLNAVVGFSSDDDTDYADLYTRWLAEDSTRDFDLLFDSSFLGAGVPVAAKKVNPIDVLFESMLKHTAIIINIDLDQITNESDVIRYIYREMPVGVTPIVNIRKTGYTETITDPTSDSFVIVSES